jgi:hypothetical protein
MNGVGCADTVHAWPVAVTTAGVIDVAACVDRAITTAVRFGAFALRFTKGAPPRAPDLFASTNVGAGCVGCVGH